jgi:hypothetical protein
MKYFIQINLGPTARDWRSLSEDERKTIAAGYQQLNQTPGVTPADVQLQPPEAAVTVRVADGVTQTTEGPLVAIDAALDGYFIYEGEDLQDAIEVAARVPAARMGGAIEVRPTVDWSQG